MKIILALLVVAFIVTAQAGNVKEEAQQFEAHSGKTKPDDNVMEGWEKFKVDPLKIDRYDNVAEEWKQFKERFEKKYSDDKEVVGM